MTSFLHSFWDGVYGIKNSWMTVFPFGILNVASYCLLAFMVSEVRSAVLTKDLFHELFLSETSKVLCLSTAWLQSELLWASLSFPTSSSSDQITCYPTCKAFIFFFLLKSVEPLANFFSFNWKLLYFSTPVFLLWVLFTISVYSHFVLSLITEQSISLYKYLSQLLLKEWL